MLESFHMAVVYSSVRNRPWTCIRRPSGTVPWFRRCLAFSSARGGGDLLADFLLLGASLRRPLRAFSASRRAVSEEHFVDELHDSPRLRWDSLTISVCSRMN